MRLSYPLKTLCVHFSLCDRTEAAAIQLENFLRAMGIDGVFVPARHFGRGGFYVIP